MDKEYGEFLLGKIDKGNIINKYEKEGFYLQRMRFEILLIKSDIYKLKFLNINKKEISTNSLFLFELKKGESIKLTIISEKPKKIKMTYEDKFGNKYEQNLFITPPRIKNKKIYGFKISLDDRNWLPFILSNLLLKYFK